ncbi:MAG: 4-hydroxy-tetrahydrodipicolinate reductase [Ignavibacteria bacterium]
MEVVLVGTGKMGKEIEKVLLQRGHTIRMRINRTEDLERLDVQDCICIDFTTPAAFKRNYRIIAEKFSGVVVGTTGWEEIREAVFEHFKRSGRSLIYASNFSIGMNIYFDVIELASQLMFGSGDFDPYIIEMHHTAKKDAPSGTAKTIREIINVQMGRDISIAYVRAGNIKGVHITGFESEFEKLTFHHEVYSRAVFAFGAVMAAEWMGQVKGIFHFRELLKTKLKGIKK